MPITINGTTGIQGVDGSAGTPALQGSDANTGISFPAADTVAISTNGSQRVTVDSSGRVGIGTTSPSAIFHTKITTDRNLLFNTNLSGDARITALNDANSANVNFVLQGDNVILQTGGGAARIDSSGRLLVGTSTARSNFFNSTTSASLQIEGTSFPTASMALVGINNTSYDSGTLVLAHGRGTSVGSNTVVASGDILGYVTFQGNDGTEFVEGATIKAEVDGTPGANDMPGRLVFSTTADGASSPTERVRITQSGRLICGRDIRDATLESTDQFTIEGNGYQGYHALNATAYTIGQNSNSRALRIGSGSGWATTGVSLAAGGTSWGTYSDERLKTDIVELSDCLDSIKDIRCISYRLTDVDTAESKKRLGIIAQDLVGKYDEAINESRRSDDDETEYLSVQYTDLVPVLIKALQEASSKIETLEARLSALETA